MTIEELMEMHIDPTELIKASEEVSKNIKDAAIAYIMTRSESEEIQ